MIGTWLLYTLGATSLGVLAMAANPRGRKVLKRWHKKLWRWNAAATKEALRATRLGKWASGRRKNRKSQPRRLTVGRRRDPESPSVLRPLLSGDWPAAKEAAWTRLVGVNRPQTVPSAPTSSDINGQAEPPKCGYRNATQRPDRPVRCTHVVATEGDLCPDHKNTGRVSAVGPS